MEICLSRSRLWFAGTGLPGILHPFLDAIALRKKVLRSKKSGISRRSFLALMISGFVPFSRDRANLLFQLCSALYERSAIIITSNLTFGDWYPVLGEEHLSAALLDRLTHRAHILEFLGESFRFRQRLKQSEQRKDPLCQEAKSQKEGGKVMMGEGASRGVAQVYYTGQGQDERAPTPQPLLLHGLDSAWSEASNPHRESGTRWRAAADVGQAGTAEAAAHGRQSRRDGNRLGDSVGAASPVTSQGPCSAESHQGGATGRCDLDSGDVLAGSMSQLRRFKRRGLIAGLVLPHAIDDSHPDVGQGSDSHTVRFALSTLALIIGKRPGLFPRRLPGELVQGVAQGLHAREAFVRFGVIATLERHGSRPGQSLDTGGIGVAAAIIAPFCQQTRGQTLAGTRQRTPHLLVLMGQKKGADRLIVAGNLLDHHQQLFDQREHQTRLGPHDDWTSNQVGTVQLLEDLGRNLPRSAMLARSQGRDDLFHRGRLSRLRCGIGLQKQQGGALLQFGKQVQGSGIVLASGRPSTGSPDGFGSGSRHLDHASAFSTQPRWHYRAPGGAAQPGQDDLFSPANGRQSDRSWHLPLCATDWRSSGSRDTRGTQLPAGR